MTPTPSGLCANCNERPATIIWTENVMSYVHGGFVFWCAVCALRAQLAFAKERAAEIPTLEARLEAALKAHPDTSG